MVKIFFSILNNALIKFFKYNFTIYPVLFFWLNYGSGITKSIYLDIMGFYMSYEVVSKRIFILVKILHFGARQYPDSALICSVILEKLLHFSQIHAFTYKLRILIITISFNCEG